MSFIESILVTIWGSLAALAGGAFKYLTGRNKVLRDEIHQLRDRLDEMNEKINAIQDQYQKKVYALTMIVHNQSRLIIVTKENKAEVEKINKEFRSILDT